jgi:dienelactone hydrolase
MSTPTVEKLPYVHGGAALEGHVAIPAFEGPRPAVLLCHTWRGQSDFERGKAERLAAELGVVAIALDVFGAGVRGHSADECRALIAPFMADRSQLRARLAAGIEAARAHPAVDATRVAVVGFCFGGLCALDVARMGADVRAAVAVHGLLHPAAGESAAPIRARVLVLHGHDDPLAPPEHVLALEAELTARHADWEAHVYGATMHAFTNPEANAPAAGTVYSARADRRSAIAMQSFLIDALES